MIKIDWFYLKTPLIMLGLALVTSTVLAFAGQYLEEAQYQRYQKSLSKLRVTHKLYKNLVNDLDLLDQYRNLYLGYKSTGLVGEERRLSWIESLESTNQVLKLPTLSFSLRPQEDFIRPGYKTKRGLAVNSSPMELNIGLLHEEDLFALLEGLRSSVDNLLTVDSCILTRIAGVSSSLDTSKVNLQSNCLIRWVTIDVK